MPSKLKPCPCCGVKPEIHFSEEDARRRSGIGYGRKAIAFTSHYCSPESRELSSRGECILWGRFDRAIAYTNEDWYATQDRAEASCIRAWNRKAAAWNRRHDGKAKAEGGRE